MVEKYIYIKIHWSHYHGCSWFFLTGAIYIAFFFFPSTIKLHPSTLFSLTEGKRRSFIGKVVVTIENGSLNLIQERIMYSWHTLYTCFSLGPLLFKVTLCLPVLTTPTSKKVYFYALPQAYYCSSFWIQNWLSTCHSYHYLLPKCEVIPLEH